MSTSILLTGATGFAGSHLARALVADGHDVTILCRSFSDTGRIADILGNVRRIDLDKVALPEAMAALDIAGVVHLATDYGRLGTRASDVFRTNFLLPVELLEIVIAHGARFFVNTDSYFCKPQFGCPAMPEYSYSKTCFLGWARKNVERIHLANIRLEHVYGPADGVEKFVPTILGQMLNPTVREIRLTPGEQRRDFVFIADVVEAYRRVIAAAEKAPPGYASYEAGTGISIGVRHFVEKLHEATASNATLAFGAIPYRSGEIMDSSADLGALTRLGYRPGTSLEDGISLVVETAREARSILPN